MTKKWNVPPPKKSSAIQNALEEFPSPPKKDGSKDPENVLAKLRRKEAEAQKSGNKGGGGSGEGKKK